MKEDPSPQLPGESKKEYQSRLDEWAGKFIKEDEALQEQGNHRLPGESLHEWGNRLRDNTVRRQKDAAKREERLRRQQLLQYDLLLPVRQLQTEAAERLGYPVLIAFKSEDDPNIQDSVELRVDEDQSKLLGIHLWFVDESGIPYRRTEKGHKQAIYPGLPLPFHFVNGCVSDFRKANLVVAPRKPRGKGKNNKGRRPKPISLARFNDNYDKNTVRDFIRSKHMLGDDPD
jgi:hypothetical protein